MAIFYFNGAVDEQWTTLGNWWMDDSFTTQAAKLPTNLDDVVVREVGINASGQTIANLNIESQNGKSYLFGSLTVNGGAVFGVSSGLYGSITGNIIFNSNSINDGGVVTGNATFNNSSINRGTIDGDATFNDNSSNEEYGEINGNATFNTNSFNVNPTVTGTITYNIDINFTNRIYVRTTGNDSTGDGSSNTPYRTTQKAFEIAYNNFGHMSVIDVGTGNFGGVNLNTANASEWPARIAVRGVSAAQSFLGGINGNGDNEVYDY
ncbi:hypothetical protein EBU95_21815, partial [bacterium]|nr:hypothetical protein [bacterium]